MTSTRFTGTAVSDGAAAGALFLADVTTYKAATADDVAAAFAAVAADRASLTSKLRAQGRAQEADIVAVAALIAADPFLVGPALDAVRSGTDAVTAVSAAAEAQAAVLASLDSPELAERAGDIRQIARAVLDELAGGTPEPPAGDFILVRREVAAADLIELADEGLAGAVSVAGGASSHAAIIARGLGVPMLTGVDQAVLAAASGRPALLDCVAGQLTVEPSAEELARVPVKAGTEPRASITAARTADGHEVLILCNVASPAETRRGLAEGAEGVGLLRTEIPFTSATSWPTAEQHERQLRPILSLLSGRPATVRLLDFSGDKIPSFLAPGRPGLAELLGHPVALVDQLRVALTAGRNTQLAILIPMVSTLAEVIAVRGAIDAIVGELAVPAPRLGIMIELAATAAAAETFASHVDFFSIGTNDLAGQVLGQSRLDPQASPGLAADPRVLELIKYVIDAAAAAQIAVSVCGDSAADERVLPLLIGLGVRAVSVPAASVSRVREWISDLDAGSCAAMAAKALTSASAEDNWKLVHSAELS